MKTAVIGTGISGIVSAYYLSKAGHDVTLFESNDYFGGHTHTIDVNLNNKNYAIDTGFIVFNNKTYPNFLKFLSELGVPYKNTEMSFSVKNEYNGLEYNGNNLNTLFAQRRNLINYQFLRTVYDILKFNRLGKRRIASGAIDASATLGDIINQNRFSRSFVENYLLPMGAAIWSSSMENMLTFPADFFLTFFENHGLLNVADRPQWYVINGGSREYVRSFLKSFTGNTQLSTPVKKIERFSEHVAIHTDNPSEGEIFDQVVIATHSDQALKLLDKPSEQEKRLLSNIPYRSNEVVLHTDTSLLPKNPKAWASWNYNLYDKQHSKATVTYNMNILQSLQSDTVFCVTLNSTNRIKKEKIIAQFEYDHPQFTLPGMEAQKERELINGKQRTYFCGAYWYNGFHEDGVRSAIDVCRLLNVSV